MSDLNEEKTPKPEILGEDWLSFILGLLIFLLSLGVFFGVDLLGWGTKLSVWVDPAKALSVVSPAYAAGKGDRGQGGRAKGHHKEK